MQRFHANLKVSFTNRLAEDYVAPLEFIHAEVGDHWEEVEITHIKTGR